MTDIPAWVRMVFLATALSVLCMQVMAANAQEAEPELQHPSDACAAYTLPDDVQNCYLLYSADLDYQRATDPTQAALTASFPVLFILGLAYLGLRLVRTS